jgi:diguanylate cyclase (GGDEF)-like protein/PAS domain S-box-containing protein
MMMESALPTAIEILENVIDASLVVDREGRVVYANDDTERVFARGRAEIVGTRVVDLLTLPQHWDEPGVKIADAVRSAGGTLEVRMAVTATDGHLVLTLQDRANHGPTPAMPEATVDPDQMLWSIASAVDAFLFAGELSTAGWYLSIFHGPGIDRLLGAEVPYEDANRTYDKCVYPEDYPAYEKLYEIDEREPDVPMELTYRLRGLDERIRWVRERSVVRVLGGRTLLMGVITDVTSEIEARESLDRARTEHLAAVARFERVVELANDLILAFDEEGVIRFANPAAQQLLGYAPEELIGATWALLIHPEDVDEIVSVTAAAFGARTETPIVVRCRTHDGGALHVSWAGAYDHEDGLMFYAGRDVTAEIAARDEIERRSRTDALTDLYNRRHVVEALMAELERSRRDGRVPGVLMVDLDHFKAINDHYRHEGGDAVLRTVGRRLRSAVRSYDMVGRWGGEEFIVVIPGVTTAKALRRLGEAIRAAVGRTPIPLPDGRLIRVTASVGAALAGESLWSVEALVDAADRALYAAKRAGRDQVKLADELTADELTADEPEAIRLAQALAFSASAREGTPEAHVREVADLAVATAVELGLTEDAILRCRLGGWLHDVGKIAMPDAILVKPGALDDAEWEVMRTHAEIGERLVRRIAGLTGTADIVRHHHERVDGTGYPDGLTGEEIPLEARIVAVADAYSALTTARPYRPARPRHEALDELAAHAGTQFDGDCVAALRSALEREPLGTPPVWAR